MLLPLANEMSLEILQADARHLPLEDESVQCIVTSPPYWGLRKYQGEQESVWGGSDDCKHKWAEQERDGLSRGGSEKQRSNSGSHFEKSICGICGICGAWRGAYGLEPAIELYIEHTVTILRELRRVLRKDGVLFWNLGDSYYNGDKKGWCVPDSLRAESPGLKWDAPNRMPQNGLKPKDLCLIPERVALAAQADGWWVRSRILWCKPNPMPESVTDRPTDAAEHIWMFTKSERYYWDAEAVREPAVYGENLPSFRGGGAYVNNRSFDNSAPFKANTAGIERPSTTSRNLRNVWTFPTQPYSGAHFATFPEEIPRRAILAATSAKGACAQCGAPWARVTCIDRSGIPLPHDGDTKNAKQYLDETNQLGPGVYRNLQTLGWQPTCLCRGQHGKTVSCVVLDPFAGSGTTGRVAIELNRRAILADIAYGEGDEYRRLAEERTTEVQRNLIGIEGVSV